MNQRKELCCIGPNTLAYGSARLKKRTQFAKKKTDEPNREPSRIVKLNTETTRKGWLVLKRP